MKNLYDMHMILFCMLKESNNEFTKNLAKLYLSATDARRSILLESFKDVFDHWQNIVSERNKETFNASL